MSSRSRGSIAACIRCRQKKRRCDQKLPRCRLCELAGVECYGYDVATRRQVPRSYVQSLEERVAYLESKLRGNGLGDHNRSHPVAPSDQASETSTGTTSESRSLGCVSEITTSPSTNCWPESTSAEVVTPVAQPGPSRDAELPRLLLEETSNSRTTQHRSLGYQSDQNLAGAEHSYDIVNNLDTGPITLPTKEAADNLTKEYFQCSNLGMPLLHEPTFRQKLDLIYNMPRTVDLAKTHRNPESKIALFFVLEAFAVALLSMQKRNPSRIPSWLADRHHTLAIRALLAAGLPHDVEGVQAFLLVGQFYYLHPTRWSVWNTVGAAIRLAVELGLHQDPPPGKLDALSLDTRRRTFWVAYSMERNISIAKAIPSCLSDGAVDVEFPSEADDTLITSNGIATIEVHVSGPKLVSLHLFRHRQIQSEMRTVLFERPSPPYAPVDIGQWQQRMRDRIDSWYEGIPPVGKLNSRDRIVIETFELTYHTALFYLYRPSTNNPTPSGQEWVAMTEAATNMIRLYRQFFLQQKLTIYWQAVENLSSAGTALMSAYAASPEVREHIASRSLESAIHMCSSVLWGMVERFPAFQGKRDAFDAAASAFLSDLGTGTPPSFGAEEPPTAGACSTVSADKRFAAQDQAPSDLGASQDPLAGGRNQAVEYLAQHSPAELQPSQLGPLEADGELDLDAQSLFLAPSDFGDLSMIWEATADLGGSFTPTWI